MVIFFNNNCYFCCCFSPIYKNTPGEVKCLNVKLWKCTLHRLISLSIIQSTVLKNWSDSVKVIINLKSHIAQIQQKLLPRRNGHHCPSAHRHCTHCPCASYWHRSRHRERFWRVYAVSWDLCSTCCSHEPCIHTASAHELSQYHTPWQNQPMNQQTHIRNFNTC